MAGGLRALGLGPGDVVAFQLPNWVEAAITFYACTMLGVTLVPIVHFYGPKELGFILRQSGARALIIVSRDRPARLPGGPGDGTRRPADLEHVVVVVAATRRATAAGLRPLRRAARAEPDRAGRPTSTPTARRSSATPRGRRPTPRAWCTPTARSAARCASCPTTRPCGTGPTSSAPRSGTPSACWAACCARCIGGQPLYMIDGWDPPTVLDAMVEEQISAGSGSTYFFTSLLDCPGFGPEHVELMRYVGLGGSPIPNAVAERADELGISLVRSYGSHRAPVGDRVPARARRGRSASTPTAGRWSGSRSGRSTRRAATSGSAGPARSSPGDPTASPATPTRPSRRRRSTRRGGSAPGTSA